MELGWYTTGFYQSDEVEVKLCQFPFPVLDQSQHLHFPRSEDDFGRSESRFKKSAHPLAPLERSQAMTTLRGEAPRPYAGERGSQVPTS